MLPEMNDYKHLPAKEFDALLGQVLKAQMDEHRARVEKASLKKASAGSPVVEKPSAKKK